MNLCNKCGGDLIRIAPDMLQCKKCGTKFKANVNLQNAKPNISQSTTQSRQPFVPNVQNRQPANSIQQNRNSIQPNFNQQNQNRNLIQPNNTFNRNNNIQKDKNSKEFLKSKKDNNKKSKNDFSKNDTLEENEKITLTEKINLYVLIAITVCLFLPILFAKNSISIFTFLGYILNNFTSQTVDMLSFNYNTLNIASLLHFLIIVLFIVFDVLLVKFQSQKKGHKFIKYYNFIALFVALFMFLNFAFNFKLININQNNYFLPKNFSISYVILVLSIANFVLPIFNGRFNKRTILKIILCLFVVGISGVFCFGSLYFAQKTDREDIGLLLTQYVEAINQKDAQKLSQCVYTESEDIEAFSNSFAESDFTLSDISFESYKIKTTWDNFLYVNVKFSEENEQNYYLTKRDNRWVFRYEMNADLSQNYPIIPRNLSIVYDYDLNEMVVYKFFTIGENRKLTVPEVYNGFEVTRVNDEAFMSEIIKEVKLPDTIKYIGAECFGENIETILIGSGVEIIEKSAFGNATNLKTIFYKDSIDKFMELVDLSTLNLSQTDILIYSETQKSPKTYKLTINKVLTDITINYWHYENGNIVLW